jgi:hypothetical protein
MLHLLPAVPEQLRSEAAHGRKIAGSVAADAEDFLNVCSGGRRTPTWNSWTRQARRDAQLGFVVTEVQSMAFDAIDSAIHVLLTVYQRFA